MDYIQYKRLFDFIGEEKYIYIVIIRNKGVKMSDVKQKVIDKIMEMPKSRYLLADVNYKSPKKISFQCCKDKNRNNSIVIKKHVAENLCKSLGIDLTDSIKSGIFFAKTTKSIVEQMQRCNAKAEIKESKEKERREILKICLSDYSGIDILGDDSVDPVFKNWIESNKKKLIKNATRSESYLSKKLIKAFGKRVKVQQPFVINGKCYYADICIKSKHLIIEVDGEYHDNLLQVPKDCGRDRAFKSIGYKTIRLTNKEACDKETVSKLIQEIKEYGK